MTKKKASVHDLGKQAEKKVREKELERERRFKERFAELAEEYKDFSGKDIDFHHPKKQNSQVAFAQIIQHNVQTLVEAGYLTQAEESFLFRISGYLDFGTNIIVKREFKNQKKKDDDDDVEAANATYIAEIIGVTRVHASRMLNSLKKKGILATGETGMTTEDGRVCTSRTWFVNPNIIYCGDKGKIDRSVQILFKNSLKNLKTKDGKKINLPVRLFL